MRKAAVPEWSPQREFPSVSPLWWASVQRTEAAWEGRSDNDAEVEVKNWQKAAKRREEQGKNEYVGVGKI